MDQERIERYISGKMDDLERVNFDKELMNDPLLAKAVEEYKVLILGIKSYGLERKIASMMPKEGSSIQKNTRAYKRSRLILWITLAATAILLSIGYLLLTSETKHDSPQELYADYYYPDSGLPTVMGKETEMAFNRGMVMYKQENYEGAIDVWRSIPELNPGSEVSYYLASAYLALGDQSTARSILEKFTSSSQFYDKSQWYLGLIYLSDDHYDRARNSIQNILSIPDSPYHLRAKELLKKLQDSQ